jgi:hypothetical protein
VRLAALHRPLPQRLPRARPQGPTRAARGTDPADLQRREARTGTRPALRSRRAPRRPHAQDRGATRGRRDRHPRLLRVPRRPLAQAALHQPARALQQRDRPPHRRRRHLPRQRLAHPPRRHALHRTKRRMARRPPLTSQPSRPLSSSRDETITPTEGSQVRRRLPSSEGEGPSSSVRRRPQPSSRSSGLELRSLLVVPSGRELRTGGDARIVERSSQQGSRASCRPLLTFVEAVG